MLLNGSWTLFGKNENGQPFALDAAVPGCVHTDLQRGGIIGDMYYRKNSLSVQWIEKNDFVYSKRFCLNKVSDNAYLEFDGLDTYCDIYLKDYNGLAYCGNCLEAQFFGSWAVLNKAKPL